jgi:uncharacterized protein YcgI (DUF1989 family)
MNDAPTVVPGGEGRALRAETGCLVVVENVAGGQVGDLFAFNVYDPGEYLSAAHTRAHNWSLFPAVGEPFVTNRRRPILTVVEDALDGGHDMLIPACDTTRYRRLGAPNHRSCAANLSEALDAHGIRVADPPQPVNLFMPVPIGPDGRFTLTESPAQAGDRVVLRAELPVLVVVSACPQDMVPLNRGGVSDLALEALPQRRPPLTPPAPTS